MPITSCDVIGVREGVGGSLGGLKSLSLSIRTQSIYIPTYFVIKCNPRNGLQLDIYKF